MDAPKTLIKLFLTCGFCKCFYRNPCTIECGHTFCRLCLIQYTKKRPESVRRNIICPTCFSVTLADIWSIQCHPSSLVQSLLDSYRPCDAVTEAKSKIVCYSCQQLKKESKPTSYCYNCGVMFCGDCAKMHTAMPGTSGHVIGCTDGKLLTNLREKFACKEHKEGLEFCCKNCKKAACQKCCIVYHRKCESVVTIESMTSEMRYVLWTNRAIIRQHLQDMKHAVTERQSEMLDVSRTQFKVQSDIRTISQRAIGLIKTKEKMLMGELDDITDTQTSRLMSEIQSGESDLHIHQQYYELMDHVLSSEIQMDLYNVYQVCESGLITDRISGPMASQLPLRKVTLAKEFDANKFHKTISIGRLVTSKRDIVSTCKSTLKTVISIRIINDKEKPDPSDVTVLLVDGVETMVVTDYNNRSVKSFWTKGRRSYSSSQKLDSAPCGVAKVGNDKVVISSWSNYLTIVGITPYVTVISTIRTIMSYKHITVLSDSLLAASTHHLPVAPWYRDLSPCIDIIGPSGTFLKIVLGSDLLVKEPTFLCRSQKGNILVTDPGSGSVSCLTSKGNIIFKYTPTGDKMLTGPRGVTTTKNGDILVADFYTSRVIQLSETGEYIRDMLTSDEIEYPQGIHCINDKLYITQATGSVKVFNTGVKQ